MTLFFKYLNITFFTFFINFIHSDSFEDVLYEWTEHMDYQRFIEADKTFIRLQEICDKSSDDKTLIECEIANIFYEHYRLYSSDQDENRVKKLLELLQQIEEKKIFSAATNEVFSMLINELNFLLTEDDLFFIEKQIYNQIESISFAEAEEGFRKDEQRVYFYENLIDLYTDPWMYDHIKVREYIEKSLVLIEKTNQDLDWREWEYALKLQLLDSYNSHRDDEKALQLALQLLRESIELYKTENNYVPLFDQLMYFGTLEVGNGNNYRSHLYLQLAYSVLKEVKKEEIGANLFMQLDRLSYQLLPGLESCEDTDEFIDYFNKINDFQKNNQAKSEEVYQTEMSDNSILTAKLYCSNNEEEQYELAKKIFSNLQNQLIFNMETYYEDTLDDWYINDVYYQNKVSALYDISDFISNDEYLDTLSMMQEFFYLHAISTEFYSPSLSLGYIEILDKNLCDIEKKSAKKYISLIEKIFLSSEIAEYIYFTNQALANLYLELVLVPSQCGLKKNVKGIYEILKKIRIDVNPSNIIGENSYTLSSYRFLADAIYDERNAKSLEYNFEILNREPSEIDLTFSRVAGNNEDINSYLKYQSNLNKLDEISIRSSTSSLSQINKNISDILESFKIEDVDTNKVAKYVEEKFYKKIDLENLQSGLKNDEALIIYTFTWLNASLKEQKEFLVQTCISRSEIYTSYKELSDNESNLIFDISNILFEDLVLNKGQSKKTANEYYSVFEKGFMCDPADYDRNNLITNFNEVFNPNLFYKRDYLIKKIDFKVFHNVYRFINQDLSNVNIDKYIGYGGVDYKGTIYKDLPDSVNEIKKSSNFFKNRKIFLSVDANKENVQNSTDAYVHFAVHNDISTDENDNILSSLVLSGNGQKRFLYPKDIANKNFTNSFIVLSACDTFKNSVIGRSTTSNLYNAFLISGAKGILSTSWDIESSSADEFVSTFFESTSLNKDIQTSFKSAQKKLLGSKKYDHPYFWASFNLYH